MENKLTAVNSANTNFKMYKSGKRWLFACSMIVSSLAAMGVATSVHADTTTTNNSGAQPQVTQTQANTNSSTNTSTSSTAGNNATGNSIAASLKSAGGNGSNQTIKTYPNKSEIDQAVNQAKQQPNLVVKQDPDQEITGNSQEEINQKIKDDYAKQQADLKNKEAQAKEAAIAKKNYDNYNNSKGDTTQLDKAVKDGQSVPGLTIKKDADQQSSFKATDSEGIRNWGTNTQSDYESQSNAIQKAIATQKQNNVNYANQYNDYLTKLKELKDKLSQSGLNTSESGVDLTTIRQEAAFDKEPNAVVSVSSSYQHINGDTDNGSIKNCVSLIVPANQDINGDFATVTWTNLSHTSYKGRPITKIVATLSNLKYNVKDGNYKNRIAIPDDPSAFFAISGNSLDIDYTYYYADGEKVTFDNDAYLMAGGMESWGRNSGLQSEAVQLLSEGQALHLAGSSVNVHSGNDLYADTNNTYGNTKIVYGSRNFDSVENYYRSGMFKIEGNHVKVRYHDIWSSPEMANDVTGDLSHHLGDEYDGVSTILGFGDVTIPTYKTTTINYHYDTAKISRIPGTDNVNATYHYDYTNYNPSTEKHFTDGSKIADNQVFSDGSVVTANIKATLPVAADIDGGLKSFTITEDYSNFAKYVNKGTFKVMNGTQDVTSQWSVSDDGNGKAVVTLIDPSKANGETITVEPTWTINTDVPNGTEFVNNATATVNNVPGTPSTSKIKVFTQNPTKDVEMGDNVQGDTPNSINGQVVAAGSTVTYPLSDKNGLPANREQQVTSHVITDNLDSALNYVSYKAYLPDKDGKLQDVTSHVLLTKDGQNLTFTDDSYLLGLYNQDPSVAFALPIIDLVVKANNDTKVIPNNFNSTFTYKDNNGTTTEKKTSNTVNISTYTPSATKDVELGDDVQGDTSNTIAGSLVEAGTLVTWPMSTKSLPANRAQDVVSHTETENLDNNLSFVSYKAYLPDKDGKLQDVTSHVQMKQDGQKLTFTDDATLIKQYNADKKAEQSLPVIDLVTKVNGQSKLIPNDFDSQLVFKDGKGNTTLKTTSNKVSIKTATAPNPVKEDLNDQGKNIDGQEVNENQHLTMQLDWDLSNDKGVNATPEMIKKGFYFADPLDAKALEAGDLSKAQVLDQNGNKVSGISFHKYNSLSEAPEFIQEQIKDNDLAARFNGPFVVAQADDPQAFYDKYVKTGSKLKVQIPVTVKKGFKGSFSNTAYQFGFGKATPTNTVTNFVKPTPKQETPKPTTPQATPTATPVATPTAPAAAPEQLSAPVSQQQPEAQQSQLPQTGNTNDAAIFGLAAAALIGSASLAGLDLRKHN